VVGWITLRAHLKLLTFSRGRTDLKILNKRCKERVRKLCVFRDGIHFPDLFLFDPGQKLKCVD
jgi:hypothetical protein